MNQPCLRDKVNRAIASTKSRISLSAYVFYLGESAPIGTRSEPKIRNPTRSKNTTWSYPYRLARQRTLKLIICVDTAARLIEMNGFSLKFMYVNFGFYKFFFWYN